MKRLVARPNEVAARLPFDTKNAQMKPLENNILDCERHSRHAGECEIRVARVARLKNAGWVHLREAAASR